MWLGTDEIAQWLRVLATRSEDPSFIPCTRVGQLTSHNSREPDALFLASKATFIHMGHTDTQAHTQLKINLKNAYREMT